VTGVSIFPIHDQAGNVTGVGGIGRDITKSKEVEKELRENERQLVAGARGGAAASQAKSEFLSSMCTRSAPNECESSEWRNCWKNSAESRPEKYLEIMD